MEWRGSLFFEAGGGGEEAFGRLLFCVVLCQPEELADLDGPQKKSLLISLARIGRRRSSGSMP